MQSIDNSVLQCIYHFGILDTIPLGGSASYKDISAKVGLAEAQVKAIVRQAAVNRVLREVDGSEGTRVEHTASSALLLRNHVMRDWYGHCVEEMFPAGAKLAEALEKYQGSKAPEDSAFNLAFNTRDPIYRFLEQHPERQARFFGAMEGVGKDPGHDLKHVVTGYPWAKLGNDATVVDVSRHPSTLKLNSAADTKPLDQVGGSSGFLSIALAESHPNLAKLIVQDYKHTVEEGASRLPPGLSARVHFVPHDFFQSQPTTGADVYVLRHICHNWSVENCARILRQIVPALKPNSKILLVEVVVTPSNAEESKVAERYMRYVALRFLQYLFVHAFTGVTGLCTRGNDSNCYFI